MKSNKIWSYSALIMGIVISIIGVVLIAGYFTEGYIAHKGDPDQSLLFWYLPVLLLGFIALVVGLSAGVWGLISIRKIRKQDPAKDIHSI